MDNRSRTDPFDGLSWAIALLQPGVRCSSVVEHLSMVQWVVGLIQQVLNAWYNNSRGMCYPVYEDVYIK